MRIPLASTVASPATRRRVSLSGREGFVIGLFATGLAIGIPLLRRERRAVQRELEARAEVERSAKARAALLGMVSHELRTPLQTLLVNLDLLAELHKGNDVDELTARMARALELLSSKLNNFAQYARLASDSDLVHNETIRIPELLCGIVDSHSDLARLHGRSIALNIDGDAILTVRGDGVRLLQIIDNYVVNALKYAEKGGVTIRCSAVDDDRFSSRAIEVCVIDEGPGIAEGEKEEIWEPYFRGRRAPGIKGSGLGLAVVELLASSVGWKVGVRPSPGGGATFYVRLPIADEAAPRVSIGVMHPEGSTSLP